MDRVTDPHLSTDGKTLLDFYQPAHSVHEFCHKPFQSRSSCGKPAADGITGTRRGPGRARCIEPCQPTWSALPGGGGQSGGGTGEDVTSRRYRTISRECCSLTLMFGQDYYRGVDACNPAEQWTQRCRLTGLSAAMDLTFVLSAIIFTLLAIVVATSIFNSASSTADFANARSYFGHRGDGASAETGPKLNGHVPEKKKKTKAEDDWCEISGSSHDHWDVVKSVLSVSLWCLCDLIASGLFGKACKIT